MPLNYVLELCKGHDKTIQTRMKFRVRYLMKNNGFWSHHHSIDSLVNDDYKI